MSFLCTGVTAIHGMVRKHTIISATRYTMSRFVNNDLLSLALQTVKIHFYEESVIVWNQRRKCTYRSSCFLYDKRKEQVRIGS